MFSRGVEADSAGPPVAIVNESFVRKFDLGPSPVGALVQLSGPYVPAGAVEIVGVVGDAQYSFVKGDVPPQIYTPRPQFDQTFNSLFFYARGAVPAETIVGTVQGVVNGIDRTLPVGNLDTLRRRVDSHGASDRIMTVLSAAFASLATVLAAVGLYGVLAFNVTQRRRELGLRLALGETPSGVRRLIMTQLARIAAAGSLVGLLGAIAAGRLAESMLFGLSGLDPAAFSAAILLLGAVVAIAGYFPAQHASRIAPLHALRHE